MGEQNFLIEGVSCSGKTTVCDELIRRGYQAIHGDRELAYQGDPITGEPTDTASHANHIWDVDRVRASVRDRTTEATFFCGGSRNFDTFIDVFDEVFILEVDEATLLRRLDHRQDEWGSTASERELVVRLHRTDEGLPGEGILIDATAPVQEVVDVILELSVQPGSA